MATASGLTGRGPLAFTRDDGTQLSVPLSAFTLSDGSVQLIKTWSDNVIKSGSSEETRLLAMASALTKSGELKAPPSLGPTPAMLFTAKRTGPEGNQITVTLSAAPSNGSVDVTATETDTYAGLTDPTNAAKMIGVDAPTGNVGDPGKGNGVVVVKQGTVAASPAQTIPKPPPKPLDFSKGNTVDVVDDPSAASPNTLFTLMPNPAMTATATDIKITITPDPAGKTFAVTATLDAGAPQTITLQPLGTPTKSLDALVAITAPASGVVMPVLTPVTLTRGAAGVAASGTAYTS